MALSGECDTAEPACCGITVLFINAVFSSNYPTLFPLRGIGVFVDINPWNRSCRRELRGIGAVDAGEQLRPDLPL